MTTVVPRLIVLACLVAGGALFCSQARAQDPDPCATCRRQEGHCRAGWPQCVARFASPGNTSHDDGYYVGGGTPFHGEPRCRDEGVWGWDYYGILFPKWISLDWSHGARYQGGRGAYRTVGFTPHLTQ